MAAEWFICIFGIFQPMSDWEKNKFEQAIQQGHHDIEYYWAYREGEETMMWHYTIDLVNMTQTNRTNGTVKRLLRSDETTTHAFTSPYPSMQIAPGVR